MKNFKLNTIIATSVSKCQDFSCQKDIALSVHNAINELHVSISTLHEIFIEFPYISNYADFTKFKGLTKYMYSCLYNYVVQCVRDTPHPGKWKHDTKSDRVDKIIKFNSSDWLNNSESIGDSN
tara:strand:+ start:138 stop:506 length:369 start_codon:yes stop_codon:yes gene_type:complete